MTITERLALELPDVGLRSTTGAVDIHGHVTVYAPFDADPGYWTPASFAV